MGFNKQLFQGKFALVKILVFSHTFPPAIDGGSQVLLKLSLALQQKARVKVLTSDAFLSDDFINPKRKRIPRGWRRKSGFSVFYAKTFRWQRKVLRLIETLVPFKRVKEFFSLFQTGPLFLKLPIKWIKKWHPKIILTGVFPTTIPVYAWLIAKLTRAKLVILPCFHINDKSFYRFPLINVLKKADLVLALTDYEKKFYINKLGINPNQIIVYWPSVEQKLLMGDNKAKFNPAPNLIFLGNQAAHKRIELLINVFSQIAKRNKKINLTIAGKRTLYSPVVDRHIKDLPGDIKKRVKVYNGFDRNLEKKLLDRAWLMALPSIHESFGLVFLEAWARKKPVITVDAPAVRQVVKDGVDGFLFKKNDLADLKKKILELINNQDLARKMGESGYNKLGKMSNSDLTVKKIIALARK